jgi:hypothetical protein
VEYDITTWRCGDGAGIAVDSDRAQVRPPYRLRRSTASGYLINAAIAYPQPTDDADMAGQLVEDLASVETYGRRSWSAPNPLTGGHKTNGNDGLEENLAVGSYYVENYKDPQTRRG